MDSLKKIVLACFLVQMGFAQEETLKWWNPEDHMLFVVEGQAWPNEVKSYFDRLPERAEKTVRKAVWGLSRQPAGLSIRFWTNAERIHVKYKVKTEIHYKNISALGVSGLDLYSKSYDGEWMRAWGESNFDSITNCVFKIDDTSQLYKDYGKEYQLYLPLFNQVEWLEIGIRQHYFLDPLPVRKEKPIVAYGTSICQGANASRSGMSWANILGRKLERPLINLGFSGNGRLEPEIIDLMTEIDAKLYILDCLPNLSPNKDDVYNLVLRAVKKIRKKRKSVPIIITAHQGFSDGQINAKNKRHSQILDKELKRAFEALKSEGVSNLYHIQNKQFGFSIDSYADYGHPNDYGMMQYANVYEKLIREILHEPVGLITTTIPKTQSRDIATYKWEERHEDILELNNTNPPKICLFGDSIINFWGGKPSIATSNGTDSWNQVMNPLGIRNFGFGWDRIENVLWRVYHDELEGFQAEKIILMIGVNNLGVDDDVEITDGLELLLEAIKQRQPNSDIILMGLLPTVGKEERILSLNRKISQLADKSGVVYKDIGGTLLSGKGKADTSLFTDGLHPNAEGYNKLAKEFQQVLKENK